MIRQFRHCELIPEFETLSFLKKRKYLMYDNGEGVSYLYGNRHIEIFGAPQDKCAGKSSIVIFDYTNGLFGKSGYTCFGHFFYKLNEKNKTEILQRLADFEALGLI